MAQSLANLIKRITEREKITASRFVLETYAVGHKNTITKTKAGYFPIAPVAEYQAGSWNITVDTWSPSNGSITFRACTDSPTDSRVTILWMKMDD